MGHTYVYNSGTYNAEEEGEVLNLEFGLFFDGTANNLYNTDARKCVLYEKKLSEEFKEEMKRFWEKYHENKLSEKEKKEMEQIWEKYPEKKLSEGEKKEIKRIWEEYPEDGIPIYKYTRKQLRAGYKDNGKDTSYENDHTNVARMYLNSDRRNYAIYIEGVGTADLDNDNSFPGFSYASGGKGLLEKVKKASEELAQTIKENYYKKNKTKYKNKNAKIKKIKLTIDAFGFSRGAAAARHFLYQVSNNKHIKLEFEMVKMRNYYIRIPKIKDANESFLNQALKKMKLDTLVSEINIRFVGLFDTVASFNPIPLDFSTDFKKYIHSLHLNEIKNSKLVIHFTALDEFRKYFSLTRISKGLGIEKNLPGCHSDVGGSYDCDNSYSEDVILGQNLASFKELEKLKNEFIEQGWYSSEKPNELVLKDETWPIQNELIGKRTGLIGYYSYLPLLWMSKYTSFLIEENNIYFQKIENNYSVESIYNVENKEYTLKKVKEYLESTTFKELSEMRSYRELSEFITFNKIVQQDWTFESEKEQDLLKDLRYNYLNQSADYRNAIKVPFVEPNASNSGRKRQEFNDELKE